MQYHFRVFKEKCGFWAECIELQGCQTQADTRDELNKNMKEALDLFLNEDMMPEVAFSLPKKRAQGRNLVEIEVNLRVALATYLRWFRKKMGFTQQKMAELIGLRGVFSYQRLESPRTANPH